jgi:HK97 family phage prohead protease
MPYAIEPDFEGCAFAVVKINDDGSREVVPGGCHTADEQSEAEDHLTALNIALSGERAIDPNGYETTEAIRAEAERGLEWRREYGRGGTLIGVARARDLASGKRIPYETVVRMSSYFARHEVDKSAEGFSPGEDGYPSAGRIAWALWGGDPAQSWATSIINDAAEDADRSKGDDMAIQFRTAAVELRAVDEEGMTFEGYAALYDSPSGDGTTPEVIKPGAFARSIAAAKRGEWDVKAYQDHNPELLLGTTRSGTLSLEDDGTGLKARISLNPKVSFHRDLAEIVRSMGRSLGMSFGFFTTAANRINDEGVRELRDVKLIEVSALTGLAPYYPGTISTVAVRSLASEAGLAIEPLRAAVNALLAGEITPDQARVLSEAIGAIIAEDEAEAEGEETIVEETPVEVPAVEEIEHEGEGIEVSVEVTIPRAVPRSVREKEIELARRAVK